MVAKQRSSTHAQQHSNNSLRTHTTLSTEAAAMREQHRCTSRATSLVASDPQFAFAVEGSLLGS